MRSEPTATEKQIESALQTDFFGKRARLIPRKTKDNPDYLFELDGKTVCAEATGIPSNRVIRYYHRKFKVRSEPPLSGKEVVFAFEPHMWVREAIQSKRARSRTYMSETKADECWLILHAHQKHEELVRPSIDNIEAMRAGASKETHGFSKILFWQVEIGFCELWAPGYPRKDLRFDLSKGYPTRGFKYWSTRFTTKEEGQEPETINLGKVNFETIYAEPLDPNFRMVKPNNKRAKISMSIEVGDTWAKPKLSYDE